MAQEFDDKDKDIEKYIVAFLSEYKKKDPNVLFNIMRSKNKNTVVYGLNMKDGKLDENVPVEVYWLDIDPPVRDPKEKAGDFNHRTELGKVETTMAYGVTSTPTANKGEWEVVLTALPARKLYLRQNDKGECTLFITINGKECVAESIFAKTVSGYVYDSCIFIEIVGRDANGNIQKEKVSP